MNFLDEVKARMTQTVEHLKTELKSIRTGRANPGMLDNVHAEIYGTRMRLKEIASINAPEPRLLLIVPFDRSHAPLIGKAIIEANLGFNPVVDGNAVRVPIPQMDENLRKEMAKQCHKRCEEAKISIRNIRQEANKAVRQLKADGHLPEDQMKSSEKKIQEHTDKYCKEAEDVTAAKENEVMKI